MLSLGSPDESGLNVGCFRLCQLFRIDLSPHRSITNSAERKWSATHSKPNYEPLVRSIIVRLIAPMKYRATCPVCGIRFSRFFFFLAPSLPHRCKACGCRHRSHPVWEWTADFIFAGLVVAVLFLAWFHFISWLLAGILILALVAIACAIFPYVTPFVIAEKKAHEIRPPI